MRAFSGAGFGSRLFCGAGSFWCFTWLDRQQQRAALHVALSGDHRLVFRLGKRVHLSGTVGAFHLHMLEPQISQAGHWTALILPPEKTCADQCQQQQEADQTQDALRIAHRLFDTPQGMHTATRGICPRELIELHHQPVLVHFEKLGIGANVTTGEGGARQLVESTGFDLGKTLRSQVELSRHFGDAPPFDLPCLTQTFTWIGRHRLSHFAMCRVHCCPETNC